MFAEFASKIIIVVGWLVGYLLAYLSTSFYLSLSLSFNTLEDGELIIVVKMFAGNTYSVYPISLRCYDSLSIFFSLSISSSLSIYPTVLVNVIKWDRKDT